MISKQTLKNLASAAIDEKGNVNREIAKYALEKLSKNDLKIFLRRIKRIAQEKTVKVKYDGNITAEIKKDIETMFMGKNIEYEKDENLGGGIIIVDNDMIVNYTMSGIIAKRMQTI